MAFRPGNNQQFYLSSKQSRKVLGVKETRDGAKLQLLDFKPDDNRQIFRFDPGEGFYWFKFAALDRYAVIHAASHDNNIPVILWPWSPGQHHYMFEFIHAEGGNYRIRVRHSGKYLEVIENKQEKTYDLVQNERKDSDSQLFYPVLLPEKEAGIPPAFYQASTDLQRTIYLSLIEKIPQAGAAIKFVVEYFWKDKDHLSDLWESMKNYVEQRIRQLIRESEIRFLEQEFLGYLNVLVEIYLSPQSKKGPRLQGLLDNMTHSAPHYTDKAVEALPLLVAYGTTQIVLRKCMLDNYEELFGEPETPAIRLNNYFNLLHTIDVYSKAAEYAKEEYRKWRLSQFPDSKVISPGGVEQAVLTDNYEGISLSWLSPRYREGTPDFEFRARILTDLRRAGALVQFDLQVEELTKAARFWKYFNPMTVFIRTFTYRMVGSYGGLPYEAKVFHMEDKYTFDRIDFFARGGHLCGIELFFKGVSYGIIGSNSNDRSSLQLEKDEFFNGVFGYAKDFVRSLWITTNKGRKEGKGSYGNTNEFFRADLPDSFGARLHGIEARHCEPFMQDDRIVLLSFRWKHNDYV